MLCYTTQHFNKLLTWENFFSAKKGGPYLQTQHISLLGMQQRFESNHKKDSLYEK